MTNFPQRVYNAATGKKIRMRSGAFPQVSFNEQICGACALYHFAPMGIRSVKIVGRGKSTEMKIKGVAFIKAALEALKQHASDMKSYCKYTQNLRSDMYAIDTCNGFNCYYPSFAGTVR